MRPFFLPDGRHFLYRAIHAAGGGPIYVGSLDSTERKLLLNADSSNVGYTPGTSAVPARDDAHGAAI